VANLGMAKSGPSRYPSFENVFYDFEAPEKRKSTARFGSSFHSFLRNWRFHRPSWPKHISKKLVIGLGQDLTVIGV
jgi:hypothetical protein